MFNLRKIDLFYFTKISNNSSVIRKKKQSTNSMSLNDHGIHFEVKNKKLNFMGIWAPKGHNLIKKNNGRNMVAKSIYL